MAGPWEAYQTQPAGPWADYAPTGTAVLQPGVARDMTDAVIAGLHESATGLAVRGEKPGMHLPPDAPWYWRAGAGAAGMAADFPLSVVGALGGAAAGTAVAPGVGTAVGGGAGAFAAPMALREGLMTAYSQNAALSWQGVWEIAKASLVGGAKGAVIGGATMGAGRLVAPMVAPVAGAAVAGGKITAGAGRGLVDAAAFGTELAALTGTAAALDGRVPTAQEFLDNAILLGGMKGAIHMAKAMRNIYAETGKLPTEVVAEAQRDPTLRKALLDEGEIGELPESFKALGLEERIKAAVEHDPRPEILREFMAMKEPPKLGEHPIKDFVRYEYITDQDTLKGVLRATTQLFQREIEIQRRGTVPVAQSAADGLKLVVEGKVAERVIGAAANDAEIVARAHIARGLAAEAHRAAQELARIPVAEQNPIMQLKVLAAMEKVSMAMAELNGVGAEAGRALNMFRAIKRDPSLLGDAKAVIALYERKGSTQDLATMVSALADPVQLNKFAEKYVQATKSEMVIEGWKAAILSGPQTHLANVLGNLGKLFVEIPESALSAAIEATRRAAKGDPMNMAQFKVRALAPWYMMTLGARDGLMVAGEVLRGRGEHLEKADVYRTAIPGKAGEIIRLPLKMLQVEDVLFRTMAERAKAYEMAVDRVSREGLHPGTHEFRAKVMDYTNEPILGLTEKAAQAATEAIQQAGAEAVFAQRLGPKMEMAQRAMGGNVFAQMVVPFVRTPANLVSWALQHTPGLNLLSSRWRADFAAGGERQSRAIARVVVGTGLAMSAYQFAKEGLLTGGGAFDPEERRAKTAAGWQPYSIKIGDKYYSYQRMEPVSKVLGIAADMMEMFDRLDTNDRAKGMALLVMMFGNMTISTTYLSGLASAVNALTDPTRYGERWYEQYASSIVPKIIGQTAALIDPHHREVDGAIDAIQSQLPFLREKLLPQRDAWGEPRDNKKFFGIMPIQVTEAARDKVRTEAMRLELSLADAPRFITERGPFKPSEKSVELTPEQRDVFRQVAGRSAMELLTPIVNAPDWDRIPDFAKAAVYKKVLEVTRKQAQYAALPAEAAARAAIRQKIIDEVIKQQQEAARK